MCTRFVGCYDVYAAVQDSGVAVMMCAGVTVDVGGCPVGVGECKNDRGDGECD